MKHKILKVFIISLIIFGIYAISNMEYAATSKLSVSKTTAKVGDTITVTASGNAASWNVNVNATGPVKANGTTSFANATESGENENITIGTVTYTVTGEGNINFSLTGQLVDGDYKKSNASGSASVKVETTQQQTQTQQTPTQQPQTQQPQTQQPTQQPTQQQFTPTFANANTTMYTTSDCNLRSSWTTSSTATSVKKGTQVTVTGTSTQKDSNGYTWYRVNYGGTKYVASFLLTSTKPVEEDEQKKKEEEEAKKKAEEEAEAKRKEEEEKQNASNKSLQKLEIDGYTLEPAFTPENTKYTLQLKENDDVEELKINAVPADEKADVTIEGNKDFSVGNKIVKITVTAQDKTTRLYTISVVKPGETAQVDDLKLAVLKVANANLDPTFDKDIKNYTIETDDPSKIKEEDIVVDPEDDKVKATIAIKDNDDGSKIITILLESEDEKDNRTGVYQINVIKPVVTQEVVTKGKVDKKIYIIFGSIIGVLLLLIIIVCIALKKTGDDDYYDDEEDDDEYYDENNDNDNDDYNQKDTNNSPKFDQSLKDAIDEANGLYNYDADQDLSPKSQILSKRIQNQDMDHTQLFDSEKFKEVSDNNSKRKGKHF